MGDRITEVFFSGYKQKMHKEEFFNFFRVLVEKKKFLKYETSKLLTSGISI